MPQKVKNTKERFSVARTGVGLATIVGGSSAIVLGSLLTTLAIQAPILDKSFEPKHLITYGVGLVGLTIASYGLYGVVDGVRLIGDMYRSREEYQ